MLKRPDQNDGPFRRLARHPLWGRSPIDWYMALLLGTVALASVFPVRGELAAITKTVSYGAVALLFFLYGAKLKTQVVLEGIANWRLQTLIPAFTFVVFPLLGLAAANLVNGILPEELVLGVLYLTILPSTVQSSIALTALGNGNVAAAICAASFSNLIGVFITPLLAATLISIGAVTLHSDAIVSIFMQILAPFLAGQLLRPWIGPAVERNKMLTQVVDRGSILLIVYSAFSAGVVAGVWSRVDRADLALILLIDVALLGLVIFMINLVSKWTALAKPDSVSFLFCGSQKSLASGVPIATILFAGHSISLIILPLMLFHQIQLMTCTYLAQRFNRADLTRTSDARL